LHSDPFFVLADFEAYLQAQQRIDGRWLDQRGWRTSALMNTARSGFFSSDRSIQDYADRIWNVDPMPVELACSLSEQGAQHPSS
jgi:starch phosphorylase